MTRFCCRGDSRKAARGHSRAWCQVSQTQTELGNDWYLERVEVTGPEGVCWVFPCEDWFGRTEDDESVGAPCPPLPGALPFPCMQPCTQE